MQQRCDALLGDIVSNADRRKSILTDPRDLHRELFSDFTPLGYCEYAGTYRGTAGTSLESRSVDAAGVWDPSQRYTFTAPENVEAAMKVLLTSTTNTLVGKKTDYQNLVSASIAFGFFGMIHPFLDGNGHMQRAIFAATITEFGYPLSSRFAIHPRPFDTVFAMMLELFSKGRPAVEGPLLAEYLGYFVDGPFKAVRGTLSPESIYERI
jgi:hypothetical protein